MRKMEIIFVTMNQFRFGFIRCYIYIFLFISFILVSHCTNHGKTTLGSGTLLRNEKDELNMNEWPIKSKIAAILRFFKMMLKVLWIILKKIYHRLLSYRNHSEKSIEPVKDSDNYLNILCESTFQIQHANVKLLEAQELIKKSSDIVSKLSLYILDTKESEMAGKVLSDILMKQNALHDDLETIKKMIISTMANVEYQDLEEGDSRTMTNIKEKLSQILCILESNSQEGMESLSVLAKSTNLKADAALVAANDIAAKVTELYGNQQLLLSQRESTSEQVEEILLENRKIKTNILEMEHKIEEQSKSKQKLNLGLFDLEVVDTIRQLLVYKCIEGTKIARQEAYMSEIESALVGFAFLRDKSIHEQPEFSWLVNCYAQLSEFGNNALDAESVQRKIEKKLYEEHEFFLNAMRKTFLESTVNDYLSAVSSTLANAKFTAEETKNILEVMKTLGDSLGFYYAMERIRIRLNRMLMRCKFLISNYFDDVKHVATEQ